MRLLSSLICLFIFSLPIFSQKLVLDTSFTPTPNGVVSFLEIQSDGKYLIAGEFTEINGAASFKLARLNSDGSLDTSFNANWLPGPFNQGVGISMMKLLPDGKILLGGGFPVNGSSGGNVRVLRLNADGSFDNTLTTIPSLVNENGFFQEIANADQLPNGKILVCGYFTKANNNPKVSLARFNNDGSYDASFTTNIDDITRTTDRCRDVAAQPDGKYLVAGQYNTINGNAGQGLTRFNADDSIDTTFTAATIPNTTSSQSLFIKPLSDGSYFAVLPDRVVRLNADGSLRLMLSSNGVNLNDIALQPNGKTLIAFRENFSRVNTDGTSDASMTNFSFSGPGNPDYPHAVKVTADGKVVVAGPFTSYWTSPTGTINRPYLARFVQEAIPIKPKFDFDGDGRDDMAVFRPGDRVWYLNRTAAGFSATQFGISSDIPVAADYDGDGKTDIAVWRADGGVWYWLKSSDNTLDYAIVGQTGDIPQQRNANGAGSKMVFRPSDARWWVFNGFNAPSWIRMGVEQSGDIPVRDDYDGDGFSNLAVYRNGTWLYQWGNSSTVSQFQWGLAGDIPVAADYDGDLRSDFAVFRPSTGVWYIKKSTEGFYAVQWGVSGDLPVPADYDGDGKTDIAIYRNGVWYIMKSTGSYHIEQFGLANDIPAQLR
jgi:uncharacterized delta-60 repeat protein